MYILSTALHLPKFISIIVYLLLFIIDSQYLSRLANKLYCKVLVEVNV